MRTRKPPCPIEKVWVDKHKYDEAERLHYEREAMLATVAPEECLELEAVNGVCNDDSAEGEFKGDLKRGKNGKKQRKRKRSPKPKNMVSKMDSVLSGLLADSVWFDKPLYDRAENLYRKRLVDCQYQEAAETELPESEAVQDAPKPWMLPAALSCSHGILSACHHVVQGIWVNKLDFDKAEKVFLERSQFFVPPNVLAIPTVCSDSGNIGLGTPDEGYVTALPTPATPSLAPDVINSASIASSLPRSAEPTVNGKPQASSLQALMSEVWLEKPLYDGAEKSFYENMFNSHPPGSPQASENHQKVEKSPSAGVQAGTEHVELISSSQLPPPTSFFLHEDSERVWLNKMMYDSAESRYYAAEALKMSRAEENVGMPQPAVVESQPAAEGLSVPAPEKK
ncbi:elongation factor 1-delta isoform X1 [Numida meleagris]|uniref:elongation factor 1-delta isoform X1 n=1 Tax=Numida meleagris TaxID=8996 RepID=UPI000B3DAF87|nr:elongation factor 1-delta isoform X1 [Numida meleagris]XP_021243171.1 elongation factor 1-delta isoform X1 [Numida meleagris]